MCVAEEGERERGRRGGCEGVSVCLQARESERSRRERERERENER